MNYLTPQKAADQLGYHVTTIRSMCRRGELPAHRVGKHWRIEAAKLARLLAAGASA